MNTTTKVLILMLGGLLILTCMGCYGLIQIHQARQEAKLIEFRNTAQRLGFEPTLNGVAEYIQRSINTGMSRNKVEQVLSNIAPLEVERGELNKDSRAGWGPIACDQIWLDLSALLTGGPVPIHACYDKIGGLVAMDFAEADLPSLEIYAPFRE